MRWRSGALGKREDDADLLSGNESCWKMMTREDKFSSGLDPWGDYLFGFILLIMGLASLLGNGLAVKVFLRKGREITVPEILLLNIAIVDLLLSGATYPAPIVAAFSHRWIFGNIGCAMYGAVGFFFGLSTIFSMMALAVFRFLKSYYSYTVEWMAASLVKFYLIPPIYISSLIWTLIPFFGWSGYEVEPFGLSCTLAWKEPDHKAAVFIISVTVFCFVLPGVVIVASHTAILHQVRRAGQMFSNRATSGKQSSEAEIQLIRVTFAVCIGYLLAWLPYTAISLWTSFGDPSDIPMWITPIPVLLAKSSVSYNPVIYVLMTRRYRVEFTRALRELLRLTGPVVENVFQENPGQLTSFTRNTNILITRPATEYDEIKDETNRVETGMKIMKVETHSLRPDVDSIEGVSSVANAMSSFTTRQSP